jgi:hypothetical protein
MGSARSPDDPATALAVQARNNMAAITTRSMKDLPAPLGALDVYAATIRQRR